MARTRLVMSMLGAVGIAAAVAACTDWFDIDYPARKPIVAADAKPPADTGAPETGPGGDATPDVVTPQDAANDAPTVDSGTDATTTDASDADAGEDAMAGADADAGDA